MKVVFLSNFLNHHQLPFCQEMYGRFKDDFKFVQTEPVNEERLTMGYKEMADQYPFLLCPYKNEEEQHLVEKAVEQADFVITGSAPESYIEKRLANNQPIFRFSERFLRHQVWRYLTPKSIRFMYHRHTKYRKRNVYVLCASVYTPRDFSVYGAYKKKTYKWGYFPEFIPYDIVQLMEGKKRKDVVELLWVARFLKLKHPEKFLECCRRLKAENIPFKARIIGSGDECGDEMHAFVKDNGLTDCVTFLGNMSPKAVREQMVRSDIFMFNSDYREGWGAVINEAMNSGCGVISSHAPGAPGFLIKHGWNGLVYNDKDFEDCYCQIKRLATDRDYCVTLGKRAYETIATTWNAKTATANLIKLMEALKEGIRPDICKGPASIAHVIPQRKVYRKIIKGEID